MQVRSFNWSFYYLSKCLFLMPLLDAPVLTSSDVPVPLSSDPSAHDIRHSKTWSDGYLPTIQLSRLDDAMVDHILDSLHEVVGSKAVKFAMLLPKT